MFVKSQKMTLKENGWIIMNLVYGYQNYLISK